ncbi:hypothetical protein [Paenibacillus sp. XY044]|uniref:hypothetical protein n=1 Tax=Paenibacillus sp. XY044 TaxID=2026089 RepID=UPI000B997A0A|nr:hypothetical protein [Paenibacillus sp. XY044]OZB92800.1 hypothetical protein CJP46_23140 [Paenibacillus sp. XY044]
MSVQYSGYQHQTLYQAEPHMSQTLHSARDRFNQLCRQHVNKHVRIETLDGDVFEGVLVHCDKGIVYIQTPQSTGQRAFLPGRPPFFNQTILPLVLYELLVISLLA